MSSMMPNMPSKLKSSIKEDNDGYEERKLPSDCLQRHLLKRANTLSEYLLTHLIILCDGWAGSSSLVVAIVAIGQALALTLISAER